VIRVEAVNKVSLIIGWCVICHRSSHERGLRLYPVFRVTVLAALNADTVGHLDLEDLHIRLIDSEVGHLNVQAMEVDTIKTLIDSLSKLSLTNLLNSLLVMARTTLMELAEEDIEFAEGARLLCLRPIEAGDRAVLGLELFDDSVEVPWESEHIGVFLMRKFGVDTESCILISLADLATRISLISCNGGIRELSNAHLLAWHAQGHLVSSHRVHEKSMLRGTQSKKRCHSPFGSHEEASIYNATR